LLFTPVWADRAQINKLVC